jgi:hypothetical protein
MASTVCQHQVTRGQIFGQDAVFGGRVSSRTQADQAVSDQRVYSEQHGDAAEDFDVVADEHHASLGNRVGECAHERGQHDVGKDEGFLQYRCVPVRRMHGLQ